MNYKVKLFHRNVSGKVLLDDLHKTAKKLGKKHISRQEYNIEGEFHPSTFAARFGSWNKALLKAGLKVKFIDWIPDDKLMVNLKKVWDTLGRQPKWEEMLKPLSIYSRSAYAMHFGSWQGALLALEKAVKTGKFKSSKKAADKNLKNIKAKCPREPGRREGGRRFSYQSGRPDTTFKIL